MIKTCQNCGYIRKATDITSEEECPKCGIYYKKNTSKKDIVATPADNKTRWADILLLELKSWCCGRFWIFRIPVLLYLTFLLYVKLTDREGYTLFDGINLGIHEMGHPLFSAFGRFMHIAGGTILQCLCPVLSMIVLGKQRDYFGITFCLGWLATNLISVSIYMSDAQDMVLTLVTIGGGGDFMEKEDMHDWHNLFQYFGMLEYDKVIGGIVYWIGILMLLLSIVLGTVLVYWMFKVKKEDITQN